MTRWGWIPTLLALGCGPHDEPKQQASASAAPPVDDAVGLPKTPAPLAEAAGRIEYLAVESDSIFAIEATGDDKGRVLRKPIAGGDWIVLAKKEKRPRSVVALGGTAFWIAAGETFAEEDHLRSAAPGDKEPSSVLRGKLSGALVAHEGTIWFERAAPRGEVVDLQIARFDPKTVAATPIVTRKTPPDAQAIAVDATHVYWTNLGSILRAPRAGGDAEHVVKGAGQAVVGLASDGKHVFWTSREGAKGSVWATFAAGGEKQLVAADQKNPAGLAVDGTHVYWATQVEKGSILRCRKSAGAQVVEVVGGLKCPARVALDGAHVYWSNACAGPPPGVALARAPK